MAIRKVKPRTSRARSRPKGSATRYSSVKSARRAFGTCSWKLPLVESGFSKTSFQKRTKFVFGAPVLKW